MRKKKLIGKEHGTKYNNRFVFQAGASKNCDITKLISPFLHLVFVNILQNNICFYGPSSLVVLFKILFQNTSCSKVTELIIHLGFILLANTVSPI